MRVVTDSMYFRKILVRDSLIQINKDVEEAMEFIKSPHILGENKIVIESANRISAEMGKDVKNTIDLIDDLFDQIETESKKRQKRQKRQKVFAT